jgi:hypothetical protein
MRAENPETGMARRDFLRTALGIGVGAVAGSAVLGMNVGIIDGVHAATGESVGNANTAEQAEAACENNPNPEECVQQYQSPDSQAAEVMATGPLIEEAAFRALPSALTDIFAKKGLSKAIDNLATGTGEGYGLTRADVIGGAVSSLIFAGAHNFTARGFDTHMVPVPQFMSGLSFWYLQRKFGFLSNATAHVANNSIVWYLTHK